MITKSLYPTLYQINTRVWMTELSFKLGRKVNLDDIPDSELDQLADKGFDWVWFLSVWQTGKEGQRISRQNMDWRKDFQVTLSDLKEDDIEGSGFAVTGYTVHEQLGGNEALVHLRGRLAKRGIKLMLDFVPNHTGLDHSWVGDHIDYYIKANESDLVREPDNYTSIRHQSRDIILAHGRDPYFSGWPDTLQLNYGNPALQEAMSGELIRIAGQCDGVRCDMAMLVLPEVFEKTWGIKCQPFWPNAIRRVRDINPEFYFMAEVYWDMEWTLLKQGFDFAYDKRLYDRLKEGHAKEVREHFFADLDYQGKMARFLENHDEPRAAFEFGIEIHKAAAVLTYLSPGLRFFHQGQLEGRKKKISPHLVRAPEEAINHELDVFYKKLLIILNRPLLKNGDWKLLDCVPAWEGNQSNNNFIAFRWSDPAGDSILVVVNYSSHSGQCYIKLPFPDLAGQKWLLKDMISDIAFEREGYELQTKGLFIDEPAWKYYIFTLNNIPDHPFFF